MCRFLKEPFLITVSLVLILTFSACGNDTFSTKSEISINSNISGVDISTGEWIGVGGSYAFTERYAPTNCVSVIDYQDKIYWVTASSDKYSLQQGSEVLYTGNGWFLDAVGSKDGIWLVDCIFSENGMENRLIRIYPDNQDVAIISLNSVYHTDTPVESLNCESGNLYFICQNELIIISESGTLLCVISLDDGSNFTVTGNDEQVYIVTKNGDGNDVSQIDLVAESLSYAFSTEKGTLYHNRGDALFLLENDDGLYEIQRNGTAVPIVLWEECSLSPGNINEIIPLADGSYYCLLESGPAILSHVDPSEIKVKTKLVIATIGIPNTFRANVARFSHANTDYYIEIVDYSDGGAYTTDNALTKLNTEIISGKCPDMICFSSISPYSYIGRNYLVDLCAFFEKDNEISLEDIAIANALISQGGVYYIDGTFNFETLVGRYSDFGDRYGWTLAEYLEIERSLPSQVETIYNMTKKSFLRYISSRYIRTAIDWTNGTCNFNSDEFLEILRASNRIRENPENQRDISFGYGPTNVGNGTRVAALSWVNSVWKLAYEEKMAGCQLSFIGWPTVDGSCGSDIYLSAPVGILSRSANADGCWEFIKYMLFSADLNEETVLPVYLPLLKAKAASVIASEDYPVQMTETDAQRFFDLVAAIDNVAIYDETVLSIIEDVSGAFFDGAKTAEETAALIQSRASIYVGERQ